MVAGVGKDSPTRELGIESPGIFLAAMTGKPGLSERSHNQADSADRPRVEHPLGFDEAGTESILMTDPHLQLSTLGQAHDVCGLLKIGREGLFNEDVTACLQGVHGWTIVREMRGEDRQGRQTTLVEEFAMVFERRDFNFVSPLSDLLREPTRR
jgi:hypothetical protein